MYILVAEDLRKAVPRDFVARLEEIRQKEDYLERTEEMKAAFLEGKHRRIPNPTLNPY